MKKIFILSLLVFAISFSIIGCKKKDSSSETSENKLAEVDELLIGAQNPETGPIAVYGIQAVAGAKLAVDEINAAGGINGKKLKLINYDSRGDKTEAANLTKRLLNANVCAIIGEVTSGGLFAMRDIAERGNTVALSAGATAEGVTGGKNYIFSNALLDIDGAPYILKFAIDKNGYKNFAIITSVNNDYSVGLSEVFKKAVKDNGGNIVAEQNISDGDTDLSAQITSLKGKNIDAIIYSGYYQEAALILLELEKQGLKIPLIGGDGFQSPDLWNVAKDSAIGTIFYAGFSSDSDSNKVQNFLKNMADRNHEVGQFTANGYDAVYMLAKAMNDAHVTNCADKTQRENLKNALATIKDYPGVSGITSFKENGSVTKIPFILEVIKENNEYKAKIIN